MIKTLLSLLMASSLFAAESKPKEESSLDPFKSAQAKTIGGALGYNVAETFGHSYTLDLTAQALMKNSPWFVQANFSAGWFDLNPEEEIVNKTYYENRLLFMGDFIISRVLIESKRNEIKQLQPYIGLGVTDVYQGGKNNIGGVLVLANMTYIKPNKKDHRIGLHYGIRDRIYAPTLSNQTVITHNFQIFIGAQYYLGK